MSTSANVDNYPLDHIPPFDNDAAVTSVKSRQEVSSSTKKVKLIYGYIREIQSLWINHTIIPDDIYNLCLQFYQIKLNIILWVSTDIISRKMGMLDMETASSMNINLDIFSKSVDRQIHTLCYIPNISNKTLTNNQTLSGIFAIEKENNWAIEPPYPCLILFDESEDEIAAKYEYKSTKEIPRPHQLLYSEIKNNIMYERDGKIYNLNLNEIKEITDLSNFAELKQSKQRYILNPRGRDAFGYEHLQMLYLEGMESIFAIHSIHRVWSFAVDDDRIPTPSQRSCGIFNMELQKWTDIKPLKYLQGPNNRFSCRLCTNMDEDTIYLFDQSDINYTYKYDLNKNEWNTLSTDKSLGYVKAFWYNDDQILNGLTEIAPSKYNMNKLDLRDRKRKWIKTDIEFDGMDKDRSYYLFQ